MKPLIIGEDSGRIDYGTGHALGHGAWRYYGAMGITEDKFWELFDTVNLFPGREKWSFAKVDERVDDLCEVEFKRRPVILYAGQRVARAVEDRHLEYYEIVQGNPLRSCIPHPSGRNRFWNSEPEVIRQLGDFLWKMHRLADARKGVKALDSGEK